MCDCYSMICKCRKFYVPIHITDFAYPREIIRQAYCPYCHYVGPKGEKEEYETNTYGWFAVDNYLFHCGVTKGDERREKVRVYTKRINGFFSLVFNKRHREYKEAALFLEESVGFNGNPNDVANLVPDCYRYQCMQIEKKRKRDRFFKRFISVDYCQAYKREIWKIKDRLRYDCKFVKPRRIKIQRGNPHKSLGTKKR